MKKLLRVASFVCAFTMLSSAATAGWIWVVGVLATAGGAVAVGLGASAPVGYVAIVAEVACFVGDGALSQNPGLPNPFASTSGNGALAMANGSEIFTTPLALFDVPEGQYAPAFVAMNQLIDATNNLVTARSSGTPEDLALASIDYAIAMDNLRSTSSDLGLGAFEFQSSQLIAAQQDIVAHGVPEIEYDWLVESGFSTAFIEEFAQEHGAVSLANLPAVVTLNDILHEATQASFDAAIEVCFEIILE
jgi:hypothetical protein